MESKTEFVGSRLPLTGEKGDICLTLTFGGVEHLDRQFALLRLQVTEREPARQTALRRRAGCADGARQSIVIVVSFVLALFQHRKPASQDIMAHCITTVQIHVRVRVYVHVLALLHECYM